MKHVKAFAIKFAATFVILYLILAGIDGITFGDVFLMSLVLGALAYSGDLFLLPRTTNTIAAMADFGLAFVVIYFMSDGLSDGGPYLTRTILASLGLMVFELFIHRYLARNVFPDNGEKERQSPASLQYQTESSEEIHPEFPEKMTDEFHLQNRDKE
ncbi:YndM family protein [Bacillus haikouensis]|uniref:YndM family protein n=1 Tax=Bacillus haikouensis TaxID=1510468 RepID=UPI001556022E|nr:YndM family protein [Bacillus haikouensis]NQD64422.1 YndM family protein [Bacillus haikouensis]